METKVCTKCKEEKTLDNFLFRNKKQGARHSACSECYKEQRRNSYLRTKKTTLDRNKKNRKKNKEWFDEYRLSLKCNRCPENHPATLDFHHINPKEKTKEVCILVAEGYGIERIMEEINKCEVLCSNCHRKHHYEER